MKFHVAALAASTKPDWFYGFRHKDDPPGMCIRLENGDWVWEQLGLSYAALIPKPAHLLSEDWITVTKEQIDKERSERPDLTP